MIACSFSSFVLDIEEKSTVRTNHQVGQAKRWGSGRLRIARLQDFFAEGGEDELDA
jgi:hypothetical protein